MNTPKIRFKGFTDDWEQRKLSEICERITRKNRNNESDLPLTIASQFGLIDQRDFFNKVVAAKDMSNYYLLKKGEFAYNKSYSNGFDYGSIKRLNAYKQGCLSTLYICFGITSDEVESDYLECFFDTLKWYGDLSMICAEGARNHGLLNVDTKGFFDEVTVDLPKSLEEQKRISVYMNALNRLITLHQRKCDETKQLKKFMLQKMFPKNGEKNPKIRFEGFTDDWEQRKFSELVTIERGGSPRPIDRFITKEENGLNWIKIGDAPEQGNYITKTEEKIKPEGLSKTREVHPGDLILSNSMSFGRPYILAIDGCIHDGWLAIRDTEKRFDLKFLCTLLGTDNMLSQYKAMAAGSTVNNLNKELVGATTVSYPVMDEQVKLGEFFDGIDHLITLHQRKCEKLKALKKFMLQNMFI